MAVERRTFLKGSAAVTGGALLAGPFQGLVAGPAAGLGGAPFRTLRPIPDERDGTVRLHLPEGFSYRSFHDTEQTVTLDDGTTLPGRHDGMGAFDAESGNVLLVRNHEVNNPVGAFGPRGDHTYDPVAGGGCTVIEVTREGEVVESYTALNGTMMNCSGGQMPWGAWITCEETVNGPDVGPDFTGAPNTTLTKPHGFIFEVPTSGLASGRPITKAGRFPHEAVSFDPVDGYLYLTEDNFAFPSGFYRYKPGSHPMEVGHLDNEGTLQMLAVKDQPRAHLEAHQEKGAIYDVEWVDIDDPDPEFPYTPVRLPRPATTTRCSTSATRGGSRARRVSPGSRVRCTTTASSTSPRPRGRRRRDRPEHRHGLRQRLRPGVGLRHPCGEAAAGLPVAWQGDVRLPRQHHGEPPRQPGGLRGQLR